MCGCQMCIRDRDFYGKANWDKRNGEPKCNAMAHNPDKTIATEGRKALDIIQMCIRDRGKCVQEFLHGMVTTLPYTHEHKKGGTHRALVYSQMCIRDSHTMLHNDYPYLYLQAG